MGSLFPISCSCSTTSPSVGDGCVVECWDSREANSSKRLFLRIPFNQNRQNHLEVGKCMSMYIHTYVRKRMTLGERGSIDEKELETTKTRTYGVHTRQVCRYFLLFSFRSILLVCWPQPGPDPCRSPTAHAHAGNTQESRIFSTRLGPGQDTGRCRVISFDVDRFAEEIYIHTYHGSYVKSMSCAPYLPSQKDTTCFASVRMSQRLESLLILPHLSATS